MSGNDELRYFLESIMSITAPVIDIFGGGMPGIGGSAVITQGAFNSQNDTIIRMRHQAADFAKEYSHQKRPDVLKKYGQDIEGSLLVLQTLSVITEEQATRLIQEVNDLFS